MTQVQVLSYSEEQAMSQLETIQLWHVVSEWASREGEPRELPRSHRKWLMEEMDWGPDPDHAGVVDGIRDQVTEDPLEIQVRGDWHSLGEAPETAEFQILLCTGGPAVRISGDIKDESPVRCRLEHQGWGKPWTEVVSLTKEQREALKWYCEQFYWDEI